MSPAEARLAPAATPPLAIFAVISAAVFWGSTGTVQGLLPETRDPLLVGAMRIWIGAAGLIIGAVILSRGALGLAEAPWRAMLGAGVAIGLYNLFFFAGVSRAGIGVGTAIAIGSGPVWVSLYERVVERRRLTPRQLMGQATCIGGAVLLVATDQSVGAGGAEAWIGYILVLLAGLTYATYSIFTGSMRSETPPATIAAGTFTLASLTLLPVLAFTDGGWLAADPQIIGLLAFLGLGATSLAYFFYTFGIVRMRTSSAVTLVLAEPLTAWVLAVLIIGEALTPLKALGALMLLVGLWIVARARSTD